MSSVPFTIVDVFSTTAFKGNPLAVVDNTQDVLTDMQMKLIARQFNLSETTFFCPATIAQAQYRLRSFLPDGKEVFGAGHNILGVWWHLANSGLIKLSQAESTTQNNEEVFTFYEQLGEDVMPVNVLRQHSETSQVEENAMLSVAIHQSPPMAHELHPNPSALAEALGLANSDIGIAEATDTLRPQVMSTSTTHHLLVPVTSFEALDRAVFLREKIVAQLASVNKKAYGLYLFAKVPGEQNSYRARFFSPGMSGEDPATGSAAGPLAVYLYNNKMLELVDGAGEIQVLQGLRVGRECVIRVTVSKQDGHLKTQISGTGVKVAEGRIAVPERSIEF